MKSSGTAAFVLRQIVIVVGAVAAYFGVRGLTEGEVATAERNAGWILEIERSIGIAVEHEMQRALIASDLVVTLANWVYIWLHWPVLVATLIWFIAVNRGEYIELRNAMIISGLIGIVIFATFPVAPPRLYGIEFVDTVTERSHAYRVLQPPAFTNAYAAVPSLHFGWNLLVGIAWFRVGRARWWRPAAVLMPAAMAWAVVATANHYVLDVVLGGLIALIGVVIERWRLQRRSEDRDPGGTSAEHDRPDTDAAPTELEAARERTSGEFEVDRLSQRQLSHYRARDGVLPHASRSGARRPR